MGAPSVNGNDTSVVEFERAMAKFRGSFFAEIAGRYRQAPSKAFQAAGVAVLLSWAVLGLGTGFTASLGQLIWMGTLVGGATWLMVHTVLVQQACADAYAWVEENAALVAQLLPILARWAQADETFVHAVGVGSARRLSGLIESREHAIPIGDELVRGLVVLDRRLGSAKGRMVLRHRLVGVTRAF
jgi:hypothetical protein